MHGIPIGRMDAPSESHEGMTIGKKRERRAGNKTRGIRIREEMFQTEHFLWVRSEGREETGLTSSWISVAIPREKRRESIGASDPRTRKSDIDFPA